MRTTRRTTKRCFFLRGEGGYSLVEMIVVTGVAIIISMGVFAMFNAYQRSSRSQKITNDLRNSCNFALDQVKSELLLAGYRAQDQVYPISAANDRSITFEYYDDNALDEGTYAAGYGKNTQVTFKLVADGNGYYDLVREVQRWNTATETYQNTTRQTLANNFNVDGLTFSYFKGDNGTLATPVTGTTRGDIRTVRASIVCRATNPDPGTKATATLTLTAEVKPRNAKVAATTADTTPPSAPQNLVSADPGKCGTLDLTWKSNTEADLGGYILFYGQTSNSYSSRITIAKSPGTSTSSETYQLTGLTSTTTGLSDVQYYIALKSYDKSGNQSAAYSNEATGDTIINPTIPDALTAFSATPGTKKITLAWSKPSLSELQGYRVYRSETYPVVPDDTPVTGNRIGDETMTAFKADKTSYEDKGEELETKEFVGCTYYYYTIVAIACDTQIPIASQHFKEAQAYYTDTTPPPTPTLTSKSGYRRVILNLDNPLLATTPDFVYTKIWFNVGTTYPVLNSDGTGTSDGTSKLLPDNGGVFAADGTVAINFDSALVADPGPPSLDRDATYSFLAVAYDRCGNHSEVTEAAQTVGKQCGDEPAGMTAALSGIDAEGCYNPVDITWSNIDPITYPDFYGYHIYRCDKSTSTCGYPCVSTGPLNPPYPGWVEQTGAYIWDAKYQDTVLKGLVPGKSFVYCIQATDCYYEENRITWTGDVDKGEDPNNDPKNNFTERIITDPVAVGLIELDPTLPYPVSGFLRPSVIDTTRHFVPLPDNGYSKLPPTFQHEAVTYWVKNTSAESLTLTGIQATWENTNAYLQSFALGDAATTPVNLGFEDNGTTLTHTSGGSVGFNTPRMVAKQDGKIPFAAIFKDQGGAVTHLSDVRENRVDLTYTYTNDSTGTQLCTSSNTIYVPLGPYLHSVTQNVPALGTNAWPVTGETGGNVIDSVEVGPGAVTVYAEVIPSAGAIYDATGRIRLFYLFDTSRSTTKPPAATGTFPTGMNYTRVAMTNVSGNQWKAVIPDAVDARVWFFITANDDKDNFDRAPEIDEGAYQYSQVPEDYCQRTPGAPTDLLTLSDNDTTTVKLKWTAPLTNDDGSTSYTDGYGYRVYRMKNDGTPEMIKEVTPVSKTDYDDSPSDLGAAEYSYYVTAIDRCATDGPKESIASTIFSEDWVDPCGDYPDKPAISMKEAGTSSVTITFSNPEKNTNGTLYTDGSSLTLYRQKGLTGTPEPIATASPYTDSPADPIAYDYYYYATAVDSCTSDPYSASSDKIVDPFSTVDPCSNRPKAPVKDSATCSTTADGATLAWIAPTENDDALATQYIDGKGFNVYRKKSTDPDTFPTDASAGWHLLKYVDGAATPTSAPADKPTDIADYAYQYCVKAVDSCNNESASCSASYEETWDPCAATATVNAPTNLTGSTITATSSVKLNWALSSYIYEGGIEVLWKRSGDASYTSVMIPAGTDDYINRTWTHTIGDAAALRNYAYEYKIRAYNLCSTPKTAALATVYTDAVGCATVAWSAVPALSLTASTTTSCTTNDNSKKITLNWKAAVAGTGDTLLYNAYRCKSSSSTTECTAITDTSHTALYSGTLLTYLDTSTPSPLKKTTGGSFMTYYGVRATNYSCQEPTKTFIDSNNAAAPCP